MVVYHIRRIVLESLPVLTAGVIIALAAGYMLNSSITEISEIPLILMMIPLVNGIGGNLGSILGARITSALHLGVLKPKLRGQRVLRGNTIATTIISFTVYSIMAMFLLAIAYMTGMSITRSLSLALAFFIAGITLSILIIFVTVASAFVSFKGRLDPDNVVIPILTSVGDVLGVTCLMLAIKIIGV
ncbi:MAG TPA: hypothetical protein EYP18_07395 [Desulfobacterales bacterium]|nr:hypothetical protein [Desulfobacterales bacterium]